MAELEARWRGFRVLSKPESPFCRAVDKALRVLSFGQMRTFLTRYITTFGRRIYVPSDWDRLPAGERYCILRHEAVHVRQFRRLTWPGMTLVYLLLPLPVGLAAGRALLEWQGYRETLVSHFQVYGDDPRHFSRLKTDIVRRFTGPDYLWMWLPGRMVARAIDRTLEQLRAAPPPPLDGPPPP
ncbi:MAG: hypothetical protein KC635_14020 [Myxococcales bacterium]|nr:hypothetical protein [Myxococcales bacterium]MCB9734347.1 hypothetical protein [Deltaproteobacteria bacterium]